MKLFPIQIVFFLLFTITLADKIDKLSDDSNSSPVFLRLYHAFNSSRKYQNRGLITVQGQVPLIRQEPLDFDSIEFLKESAKAGDFYFVKAEAYHSFEPDSEPYHQSVTSIRSCALLQSSLHDQLILNLDPNDKFIFLNTNVPNGFCESLAASSLTNNQFNTSLFILKTALSHGPETKHYLARIEKERMDKLRDNKQDNRSFFAKYWMYIVPAVIFMLISSSMNAENGSPQGR